jgi:hypothetical protein
MSRLAITCSGATVDVEKPHPSMISARDIAQHLAKQCMYYGAPHSFYSVAQHSCVVAAELARTEGPLSAIYGLLHHADQAFAVLGELSRANLDRAIHEAFDLDWPAPIAITKAMNAVHHQVEFAELRHLLAGRQARIRELEAEGVLPLKGVIRPVAWDKALDRFLAELRIYATMANIPNMPAFGGIL